jgi:hypothetical protein
MLKFFSIYGVFLQLSGLINNQLKSGIRKYSLIPTSRSLAGHDFAVRRLYQTGLKTGYSDPE